MKNEVVVITGASAGLGRAIARQFGNHGASVGLIARGVEGLEGAKREIEATGGKALVLPTDVADPDAMEKAGAAVAQAFGPVDIWHTPGTDTWLGHALRAEARSEIP